MGYFVRVLGRRNIPVTLGTLRSRLKSKGLGADVAAEVGSDSDWTQALVSHANGDEIADIEKNVVAPGSLGEEEIGEFMEEIEDALPRSGVDWLRAFLPRVKVIYAFRILQGADVSNGWEAVHALLREIRDRVGGIVQADGEGYSNRDGNHIVWQFSDSVTGSWNMAVRGPDGGWVSFRMDLGNQEHREAFLNGEVPDGVETD